MYNLQDFEIFIAHVSYRIQRIEKNNNDAILLSQINEIYNWKKNLLLIFFHKYIAQLRYDPLHP